MQKKLSLLQKYGMRQSQVSSALATRRCAHPSLCWAWRLGVEYYFYVRGVGDNALITNELPPPHIFRGLRITGECMRCFSHDPRLSR